MLESFSRQAVESTRLQLASEFVVSEIRTGVPISQQTDHLGSQIDLASELVKRSVTFDDAQPLKNESQLVVGGENQMLSPERPYFTHPALVGRAVKEPLKKQRLVMTGDQLGELISVFLRDR